MAFSKANKFEPPIYHFSLMCKALSHPARVKIINNIVENQTANHKQLTKGIPLDDSTISQHIKILREMNIVVIENNHAKLKYKLNLDITNTTLGLIQLARGAEVKFTKKFDEEIPLIERRIGIEDVIE